jgi:hypothetical protein
MFLAFPRRSFQTASLKDLAIRLEATSPVLTCHDIPTKYDFVA